MGQAFHLEILMVNTGIFALLILMKMVNCLMIWFLPQCVKKSTFCTVEISY